MPLRAHRASLISLAISAALLPGCALLFGFDGYEGETGGGGFEATGGAGDGGTGPSGSGEASSSVASSTPGSASSSGPASSTAQGTSTTSATSSNSSGGTVATTSSGTITCSGPSECPTFPNDDACRTTTCISGECGLSFAPAGTPAGAQVAGDCQVVGCDGSGNIVGGIAAPADVPNDGNGCTTDTCSGATPVFTPVGDGTACSDGLYCNGNDTCLGGQCAQHTGNPCFEAQPDSNCSDGCSEVDLACTALTPFAICRIGNDYGECDQDGTCVFL